MNNTEKENSIESMSERICKFMELIIDRKAIDGKLISEVCDYDIVIDMKRKCNKIYNKSSTTI